MLRVKHDCSLDYPRLILMTSIEQIRCIKVLMNVFRMFSNGANAADLRMDC